MPLYLVRWPNLSASIVKAENRIHLLDILDELDNAEGVRVRKYEGLGWVGPEQAEFRKDSG